MKKQRKLTVIASHASSLSDLPKLVLASFACGACTHTTVTVAGSEPFCPHCGSDEVAEVNQEDTAIDMAQMDEEDYSSLVCPNCHVSNILSDVDLASTNGKIGCVTCGQPLEFDVEQLSTASDDEDEFDEEDENAFSADDVDEFDEDEEEFATTASHSDILSNLDRAILLASSEEEEDEEEDEEYEDEDEGEEDDEDEDDEEIDEDEDEVEESSVKSSKRGRRKPVTASLLDLVLASMPEPMDEETAGDYPVDFIPYGDEEILAMVNGVHVATLKKSSCKANQDIFGSDEYMEALSTSFEDFGLEDTLANYGFELSTLDLDEEVIDNYIEARASKEHEQELSSVKQNYSADMQQSLELAATGLSRGLFAQHAHTVKQRLVQDLTAANVRNAQHVVDKAFAATEDQYVATLMAIAQNLVEKSPEVRNQLAETIASLRPQVAEASAEDSLREKVEASLASPMVPSQTARKPVATASTTSGSIVRQATAGRGLFRNR